MASTTSVPAFRNEPVTDFSDPTAQAAFRAALARVGGQLGRRQPLWIGGQPVTHAETFDSINPAHPDQVVGTHVVASVEDVDAAVQAAERAFPSWAATPAELRAEFLFRAAELIRQRRHEVSALMVLEVGKAWGEADGEAAEAVDLMEWYARQMLRLGKPKDLTPLEGEEHAFYYVPLGVGAVISPWNFPLALTTGMLTAAVVAGNSVVLKPSSASPTTVAWLVDLFRELGLPNGVINYLTGPGSAIGDALVEHPRVRFIAFTGSRDVGVRINERASKVQPGQIWLKRIQLEMGGKNAIVVDAVYERVLAEVVERARALRIGDPIEPDTQVGPLIDAGAERKVLDYIAIGKGAGELMLGGEKLDREGYFVAPTIFADVSPRARIAQEEIFGPVLAFIRAHDFDDALAIANGTEYGLTGSLYSRDAARLERAKRDFHVGNLYLNRKCTGAIMGVHPFGGFNMSGTDSKAGGPDYLLFFLQGKSVGSRV